VNGEAGFYNHTIGVIVHNQDVNRSYCNDKGDMLVEASLSISTGYTKTEFAWLAPGNCYMPYVNEHAFARSIKSVEGRYISQPLTVDLLADSSNIVKRETESLSIMQNVASYMTMPNTQYEKVAGRISATELIECYVAKTNNLLELRDESEWIQLVEKANNINRPAYINKVFKDIAAKCWKRNPNLPMP
jgi:hypothetical protein